VLRTLLICGLLAGVAGGLLAVGFAEIAGEPAVGKAITFEAQRDKAQGVQPGPELVPRTEQKTVGLLTAGVVYGLALGGLFALAFGFVYGRVGRASPGATALWLAAGAFVTVFLVPFVKYPSNPPSIGDPDTIDRRTLLYLTMVAISLLAASAAVRLRVVLARRMSGAHATLLAGVLYLVVVIAAGLALPGIHEVPRAFSATTLWSFREATVGMQLVLWTSIGLVFAATATRVMAGKTILPRRASASERVAATRE
jgi:Probable cobalt transporter subunit (CbtA)